jgi:hypothetical protein
MRNTFTTEFRLVFSGLIAVIFPFGVLLYVFSTQTASYWPWIIPNARSAMLIGAVYIAAVLYFILALRADDWNLVKHDQGGLFIFLMTLVVATMVDWDKFRPYFPTTLIWLGVYYVGPLLVPIVYRLQTKDHASAPRTSKEIAPAMANWIVIRGFFYLALFFIGLLFAESLSPLLPWSIQPLELRVFSAQFALNGWRAIIVLRYGRSWEYQRLGLWLIGFLGLLQFVAVFAGATAYNWSSPLGILLPAMFLEWFGTSLALLYLYRK